MNRLLLAIITAVGITFLAGCSGMATTVNESNGVNEISTFFGGNCIFELHDSIFPGKGKKTIASLEISNSEVAELYSGKAGLCASNAAYLFYHNLKDEKKNISIVKIAINYKNGSGSTQFFTGEQLDSVITGKKIVDSVAECFKQRKYGEINDMVTGDTAIWRPDRTQLLTELQKCDSLYGRVSEFNMFGYKKYHRSYGDEFVYYGLLMSDKHNAKFTIAVLAGNKDKPIDYMDFNF